MHEIGPNNKSDEIKQGYLVALVFFIGVIVTIAMFIMSIRENEKNNHAFFTYKAQSEFVKLSAKFEFIQKKISDFYLLDRYGEGLKESADLFFNKNQYAVGLVAFQKNQKKTKIFLNNNTSASTAKKLSNYINGNYSQNKRQPDRSKLQYISTLDYIMVPIKNQLDLALVIDLKELINPAYDKAHETDDLLVNVVNGDQVLYSSESSYSNFLNKIKKELKQNLFSRMPSSFSKNIDLFGQMLTVCIIPNKQMMKGSINFFSWVVLFSGSFLTIITAIFFYSFILKSIKVKRSNEKLIEINTELDNFLHMASHDLKEPVRGVMLNMEFLEEDNERELSKQAKSRAERIKYLCNRILGLISSITDGVKLQKSAVELEKIELKSLLQDVEGSLLEFLNKNNVTISYSKSLPRYIYCEKLTVRQAFYNLIVNGVIYNNKKKKEIYIGCKAQKNIAKVFYVKDNGIGIDEIFYEKIFLMFKRLSKESKGTGIGLPFVKKIIETHKGKIWVESKLGDGTTFFFTLGQ